MGIRQSAVFGVTAAGIKDRAVRLIGFAVLCRGSLCVPACAVCVCIYTEFAFDEGNWALFGYSTDAR